MKTCNVEAKDVKGNARKTFIERVPEEGLLTLGRSTCASVCRACVGLPLYWGVSFIQSSIRSATAEPVTPRRAAAPSRWSRPRTW
jgi:hypothetical protein